MNLYLRDVPTKGRILSDVAPISTDSGGSHTSSLITPEEDISYIFSKRAQRVLITGQSSILLTLTFLGKFSITPWFILRKTDASTTPVTYIETDITPTFRETQTTRDSGYNADGTRKPDTQSLTWNFTLNTSHSLENLDLILRLRIRDVQVTRPSPDQGSSLTFSNASYAGMNVKEGEIQNINLYSTALFSFFQKPEKIFLWSNVVARQSQTINPVFIVKSKEIVNQTIYSNINLKEEVSFEHDTRVHIHNHPLKPFGPSEPYLKNIEMGDLITYPGQPKTYEEIYNLRRRKRLDKIVDDLVYPEIIIPPEVPTIEYPDASLSNSANKFVEMFEMIKTVGDERVNAQYNKISDIFNVPGDTFKVLMPEHNRPPIGASYVIYESGTTEKPIKEWRLPLNFTNTSYILPLGISPKIVQPNVSPDHIYITVAPSLWLVIRQKTMGANVSAFYRGQPGRLLLKRQITSTEDVTVWMWENVTSTTRTNGLITIRIFEVDVFVSNPSLRPPGFQGTSAAMMIA